MTLPPDFDEPAFRAVRRLDAAVDRGQARVLRVLWFWVPSGSVALDVHFQQLLVSRFFTDIALQALLYGALIAVARSDGDAVDAALLGVAYLAPGVLLGMFGGIVADQLPKRVALAGAYVLMGAIALLVPTVIGTSFRSMLVVLFGVRILHQVSQPSEASAVPLVASQEELASATSFLSFASSAGEVVGKSLLAPVLVRAYGVDPVTTVAGALFLFSATRVFDLRPPRPRTQSRPSRALRTTEVVRWLLAERTMLWMLILGALGSTTSVVLGVLGPQYTRDVLGVDPANALYVFAPAALGLVVALAVAPAMIKWMGERRTAMVGFVIIAIAMVALGLVDAIRARAGWLAVVNIPGVPTEVELAAEISIFLGLAITLAAISVQTYIARRVPLELQGRTFALLGVLKDGLAIAALLTLGLAAEVIGVRAMITLSPLLLLGLAFAFDRFAGRWRQLGPRGRLGLPG